jgi:flagella basal body P-ring formation protein FlgA
MMMLAAAAALAVAGCLEVDGPRILAADLARADAAFGALDPATSFGFTPVPGARRILDAATLKRMAAPAELALAPTARICVARLTEPLSREAVIEAMRASLGGAGASLEIVELSGFSVPRGPVEFPAGGLGRPAAARPGEPVLWRGYVRYDGRSRFPVWARVRLIDAAWLRLEEAEVFPPAERLAASIEEVAGRVLRAAVAEGAPVALRLLAEPREVERGDRVRIVAAAGAATVAAEGEAETAGARGDTVTVRNLATGRRLRATVEAKGRVVVGAAPGEVTWRGSQN